MLRLVASSLTLALLVGTAFFVARLRAATARSLWLVVFTVVVAGGVTMMVTHAFVTRWGIRTNSTRDGLWAMMSGEASRPFVFRRLAPDIVRVVTDLAENHAPARAVDSFLEKSTLAPGGDQVLTRHETIAFHVASYLVWLAWLGTVVVGARLLRSVRGCSWFEGLVTACLAVVLVPLTLGNGGYIYDSVEVLLWTTLVLCISEAWLVVVPAVFAAVLFNKESALATVPALFPLLARRAGPQRAAVWTAALGAAAVAWLLYVRHAYAAQPGDAQEWSFWTNLAFWSRPGSYFKIAAMFSPGLPAPRGANLMVLLLLLIPLRFGWRHVRLDMRQATILAAVVMIPLLVLSGCIDETRALGPLFPFLFVVGSEGVNTMFLRRSPSGGA